MPIKNDIVFCLNHPDIAMAKAEGFNAITAISVSDEQVQFRPDTGLPVVVHYCEVCGYIESYLAPKTKFWGATANTGHQAFETAAKSAIGKNMSKLGIISIETEKTFQFDGDKVEIDVLGTALDGSKVFFELKNSGSTRAMESGANQLVRLLTLYNKHFPHERIFGALVVPSTNPIESKFNGFSIIKVDEDTGTVQLFN